MKILFLGSVIFYLTFTLHLIIWKIRIPKNQTKMLLQIFFGMLIISFIILGATTQLDITEYLHIALFFTSLTLGYITTYSALEVDSPSLVVIMNIAKAGRKGLDEATFAQLMNDNYLIKPRIIDLLTNNLAHLESDKYKLTIKGKLVVGIFVFYRKLLNLSKGG